MTQTVKGFTVVNEADVFLEFFCFFYDPTDAGNLISGSSAFSKSSLNIWKFSVHVLLKPSLENFEMLILAELFQILKDDPVKVLQSIYWKIGKLSSGYRTGKSQFSFQFQRMAMPKNAQTTT